MEDKVEFLLILIEFWKKCRWYMVIIEGILFTMIYLNIDGLKILGRVATGWFFCEKFFWPSYAIRGFFPKNRFPSPTLRIWNWWKLLINMFCRKNFNFKLYNKTKQLTFYLSTNSRMMDSCLFNNFFWYSMWLIRNALKDIGHLSSRRSTF